MHIKIIWLLIGLIVAIWVYSDAKKRGKNSVSAFLWFLGNLPLWIVFLPTWIITRPKLPNELPATSTPQLCVHCGKYYEGNPSYCPNCGKEIEKK